LRTKGLGGALTGEGGRQRGSGEIRRKGGGGELRSLGLAQGGRLRKRVLVGWSMSCESEERRRGPWCLLCQSDSHTREKKGVKGGGSGSAWCMDEEEGRVATQSEEGVGGLAAGNARGRRRRWPVGRLPREVGERREEGGGGPGVWAMMGWLLGRPREKGYGPGP
jgi:hypothetical protein